MPKAAPKEFKIPTDLLQTFGRELRFVPPVPHPNGYIVFDKAMLRSILLSNDLQVRKGLAEQLDRLERAGGQLVIMGS